MMTFCVDEAIVLLVSRGVECSVEGREVRLTAVRPQPSCAPMLTIVTLLALKWHLPYVQVCVLASRKKTPSERACETTAH